MKYIMEIIFILVGIMSVYFGIFEYQFWMGTVPGGGFMPVLVGGLIIIINILTILGKKNRLAFKIDTKSFITVAFILVMLALSLLIGLIPSLTVMIFIWLKWFERYSLPTSIATTLITSVFTYAIFGIWLKVPFPTGLLNIRF